MAEYKFSVCVYPLGAEFAADLRERLQELVLAEIERQRLFCGPVEYEVVEQEVTDGQAEVAE